MTDQPPPPPPPPGGPPPPPPPPPPGGPPPPPPGQPPPYQQPGYQQPAYQDPAAGQWGTQPYQPYTGQPVAEYAGIGARFVALFVDQLLIFIGPAVVGGVLLGIGAAGSNCQTVDTSFGASTNCNASGGSAALVFLGVAVFFVGYLVMGYVLWAKPVGGGRQTIGQKLASVRVVDAQSGDPALGSGRAYGRWIFRTTISGWFCYLGFLWAFWDDRKQAWQDKVANTIVLKA